MKIPFAESYNFVTKGNYKSSHSTDSCFPGEHIIAH